MRARQRLFGAVNYFVRPWGFAGWLAGWEMALRRSNRKRNRWAVALLDVQPQDHILEIGFGPGLAIRELARRATDGFVLGIDHSEVMVRQAAVRNRAAVDQGRVELRLDPPWTCVISARCSTRRWLSTISGCGPNQRRGLAIFAGRCGRAVEAIVSQPRCLGASAETTGTRR